MKRIGWGGILVLAVAAWILWWFGTGCASFQQICRYDPAGQLVLQSTSSRVLGTGETELATTACAAVGYSTRDTGLSDNGKDALGVVAEGAARGAAGAVVPSPGALGRLP